MLKTTTTLSSFLLFISCRQTPAPDFSEKSYFPLEPGTYSEFRVERTKYISDQQIHTSRLKVRRSVQHSFEADGQLIFPLQYTREDSFKEWKTDSVSAAWISAEKVFEQENGRPVIKMLFPLSERLKWKCDGYSIAGNAESLALHVNQPMKIGGQHYPHTVTIVRQDDSTLLSRKKYIEIYAANVGLVLRERLNIQYCHAGDCIGKGIIESGWKEMFIFEKIGKQ
ncbi:hypothetical protein [Dyadobacter aurulentus]|uniref:hypothetical protein n=1 Tax=Dyadobacter sp. UC 10 TaxID=2605428 RepID=UPI0011F390D8|nr:hypothetical protein [Dyadobacter sp. UC 10]KAA0989446.1 hypothetical protein FXO21_04380 [Dyadobacter sp. UC 10]